MPKFMGGAGLMAKALGESVSDAFSSLAQGQLTAQEAQQKQLQIAQLRQLLSQGAQRFPLEQRRLGAETQLAEAKIPYVGRQAELGLKKDELAVETEKARLAEINARLAGVNKQLVTDKWGNYQLVDTVTGQSLAGGGIPGAEAEQKLDRQRIEAEIKWRQAEAIKALKAGDLTAYQKNKLELDKYKADLAAQVRREAIAAAKDKQAKADKLKGDVEDMKKAAMRNTINGMAYRQMMEVAKRPDQLGYKNWGDTPEKNKLALDWIQDQFAERILEQNPEARKVLGIEHWPSKPQPEHMKELWKGPDANAGWGAAIKSGWGWLVDRISGQHAATKQEKREMKKSNRNQALTSLAKDLETGMDVTYETFVSRLQDEANMTQSQADALWEQAMAAQEKGESVSNVLYDELEAE